MTSGTTTGKDCCGNEKLFAELDQFVEALGLTKRDKRRKGELIKVLHRAQELFGYLPEVVQKHVAALLGLQHAEVSGVISFYNYFTTTPKGKYAISVCTGTACYVKGSDLVLAEFEKQLGLSRPGEVTADGLFSVDSLRCVGACGLAPVVLVNEKVFGRITPGAVKGILKQYRDLDKGEKHD